jgi:hypothetical protein
VQQDSKKGQRGGQQQLQHRTLATVLWSCALLHYLPTSFVLLLARRLASSSAALRSPETLRQVMHATILVVQLEPQLGTVLRRHCGELYGRWGWAGIRCCCGGGLCPSGWSWH